MSDVYSNESNPNRSKWTANSWLLVLFWVTTGLCGFQICAGIASHSLALLGDSVHACLDVLSYGVAILTEKMKARRANNTRHVAMIDLMACLLSILIVCYASYYVCDEAIARFYLEGDVAVAHLAAAEPTAVVTTPAASQTKHAGLHAPQVLAEPFHKQVVRMQADPESAAAEATDYANVMTSFIHMIKRAITGHDMHGDGKEHHDKVDVDGTIMFVFAVVSTILNGWLAWVGFVEVVGNGNKSCKDQSWLDWLHNVSHAGGHVHGPACGHAHTDDTPAELTVAFQTTGKKNKKALCTSAWHKNCNGAFGQCNHDLDLEAARKAKETPDAKKDESTNLNLTLQWLHVLTDALRGVVLFIASLCIMMKWVDPSSADAGVAVVVVATVVLGSLSLLPSTFLRAKEVMYPEVGSKSI